MQSIIYPGIFTSQAFFAVIFLALGGFLYHKSNSPVNPYSKTDRRITIAMLSSLCAGLLFLGIYIAQLFVVFK